MKLTEEQLKQIHNYIQVSGIKYYDVRMEIVDHFANILEERLDENSNLDFRLELENIHKGFSDEGFSRLLKEKTKAVTKMFYKSSLNHLIGFFKIPRIIITLLIFFGLFKILELFDYKREFYLCLLGLGLIFSSILIWKAKERNKSKQMFLCLGMTMNFFQFFHLLVISLQLFNNYHVNEGYENIYLDYIHVGFYVLLILFFWSAEYVYHQNKKLVKEQYPNVLV